MCLPEQTSWRLHSYIVLLCTQKKYFLHDYTCTPHFMALLDASLQYFPPLSAVKGSSRLAPAFFCSRDCRRSHAAGFPAAIAQLIYTVYMTRQHSHALAPVKCGRSIHILHCVKHEVSFSTCGACSNPDYTCVLQIDFAQTSMKSHDSGKSAIDIYRYFKQMKCHLNKYCIL